MVRMYAYLGEVGWYVCIRTWGRWDGTYICVLWRGGMVRMYAYLRGGMVRIYLLNELKENTLVRVKNCCLMWKPELVDLFYLLFICVFACFLVARC